MRRGPRRAVILATLIATVVAVAPGARAATGEAFHGVVTQGRLDGRDFERMRSGGVATVRVPVAWWEIEPSEGQFEWRGLDRIARLGAAHDVRALPVISGTPEWLSGDAARPPIESNRQRDAWRAFLRELVGRYGRGGEFWTARRERLPFRQWQIWNEPNFPRFYAPGPSPRGYARLVRLSAEAIRNTDDTAEIVLAGVAPVGSGPPPDIYLRHLYAVRGIERDFDAVALHPYARNVHRLRVQVRTVRNVMDRAGDRRTPLELTEVGWASGVTVGEADTRAVRGLEGQARMLGRAYRALERRRGAWGLGGVHWFAWQDAAKPEENCSFCQYAGLFTRKGKPKPAWRAFKRVTAP